MGKPVEGPGPDRGMVFQDYTSFDNRTVLVAKRFSSTRLPRPRGTHCATGAPRTSGSVPGFVTQTEIDGTHRIVTFFDGFVARERLVSVDDDQRRLAWSIADGVYEHHNSFAQVLPAGDGRTRFVWITDFLPDDSAERLDGMMERGIGVIGATRLLIGYGRARAYAR